jgi:hypothetical protein
MSEGPRLTRLFAVAIIAILGGAWGAAEAHAATIPLFTGSWQVEAGSGDGAGFQDQSIGLLIGPLSPEFTGFFGFDGSISNYSEQGSGCSTFTSPCLVTWSGVLSGGTVSFGACCGQTGLSDYSFQGVITGGSFQGAMGCDFDECVGQNFASLSFISTSTRFFDFSLGQGVNVWSSQGTLDVRSCLVGEISFGNCPSAGILSMTTSTVPEPGSMTFVGAGMGAVAALRRRRRRRLAVEPGVRRI